MVSSSVFGLVIYGNNELSNNCHILFAINSLALLLSSSYSNFISDYSVKFLLFKCLRAIELDKLLLAIVVTNSQNLILLVTGRVVLILHCMVSNVLVFPKKSRSEMNNQIVKNHSKTTARVFRNYKKCEEEFYCFYFLREHKRKDHGAQTGSGAQSVDVE